MVIQQMYAPSLLYPKMYQFKTAEIQSNWEEKDNHIHTRFYREGRNLRELQDRRKTKATEKVFRESKICLQKSKNTSINENSYIWMKIHKSGKITLDGRRAYVEKIITCKVSKNVS